MANEATAKVSSGPMLSVARRERRLRSSTLFKSRFSLRCFETQQKNIFSTHRVIWRQKDTWKKPYDRYDRFHMVSFWILYNNFFIVQAHVFCSSMPGLKQVEEMAANACHDCAFQIACCFFLLATDVPLLVSSANSVVSISRPWANDGQNVSSLMFNAVFMSRNLRQKTEINKLI